MMFNARHVFFGDIAIWAQSRINAVLQHIETIVKQELTKLRSGSTLSFSIGRQIEKYCDPHDFI